MLSYQVLIMICFRNDLIFYYNFELIMNKYVKNI